MGQDNAMLLVSTEGFINYLYLVLFMAFHLLGLLVRCNTFYSRKGRKSHYSCYTCINADQKRKRNYGQPKLSSKFQFLMKMTENENDFQNNSNTVQQKVW